MSFSRSQTPALPAKADGITSLQIYNAVVGKLLSSIVAAVNEGRTVSAGNKKLIADAAEEIRKATFALPDIINTATTDDSSPEQPAFFSSELKQDIIACVREEITQFKKEMVAVQEQTLKLSYAQVATVSNARAPPKTTSTSFSQSSPQPPCVSRPAIIVSSKTEVKTKQDLVEAWRKSISFKNCKFAPARIQAVSNHKLRVEFENAKQRDETLGRLNNSEHVVAETARSIKPMLIIKGISKDVPIEEVVDIIRDQNTELRELVASDEDLKVKFKRNNRSPNLYNVVIQVNPRVYRTMINMSRICLDHQRVQVEDFSPFIQCFQCLQFGHIRAKCTSNVSPCSHCAQLDHQIHNCTNKETLDSVKCFNCFTHNTKFNTNIDTNHSATTNVCPRLRAMKDKITARVDYGSD
ncbi:hypothetical protein O0L34_g1795 [Tuta absoluta]|nr:hypothetical protein O0L34_g1795 [Tuta absoluta]